MQPPIFFMVVVVTATFAGLAAEYVAAVLPRHLFGEIEYRVRNSTEAKRIFAVTVMAAACTWVFHSFGLSAKAVFAVVFLATSLSLAIIDHETWYLPDLLTIPLLLVGLVCNLFGVFTDVQSAIWGAAAAYGSLWLLYWTFKLILGQEVIGEGDFKLYAAIGAWLGIDYLLIVLLIAGIGLVAYGFLIDRRQSEMLPMGPYLALGGAIGILFGPTLKTFVWGLGI